MFEKLVCKMNGDDVETENEPKLPEFKLDAKQAQGFIAFFRKLPEVSSASYSPISESLSETISFLMSNLLEISVWTEGMCLVEVTAGTCVFLRDSLLIKGSLEMCRMSRL
jgi:hypothetical protein